jgi:archaellum component FlaC
LLWIDETMNWKKIKKVLLEIKSQLNELEKEIKNELEELILLFESDFFTFGDLYKTF